jgi:hypothetical protein
MKTAKLLKDNLSGFTGHAAVYELNPPMEWKDWGTGRRCSAKYVVVSAAVAPFSGAETYIFPATKAGMIRNWGELDGSYRGGLSHEKALSGAGYKIG